MDIKYVCECESWQGLLQQLVNLVGHGYYFYHVTVVPSKKSDSKKLKALDQKMILKYKLEKDNKDVRRYRKQLGLANFRYLRWQHLLVVLHTEGYIITEENPHSDVFNKLQIKRYILSDLDEFIDIRRKPMEISIGEEVSLNVQFLPKEEKGEQATVKFTRQMLREKKAELAEYIEKRQVQRAINCFNNLNGIPAYRGTILQKRELKTFVWKEAKRHGVKFSYNDLFVNSSRNKATKSIFKKEDA